MSILLLLSCAVCRCGYNGRKRVESRDVGLLLD